MIKNRKSTITALVIVFVLAIPFVAMRFTEQVNWSLADFIIAGLLLLGASFVYGVLTRGSSSSAYRVVVGIILLVALLLIWAELGVGIFGTPWAGS